MGHPLYYESEIEKELRRVSEAASQKNQRINELGEQLVELRAWRETVRGKLGELRAECEEEMPTPGQAATNSFADGYYDGLEYAIGKVRKLERELGLAKEQL